MHDHGRVKTAHVKIVCRTKSLEIRTLSYLGI